MVRGRERYCCDSGNCKQWIVICLRETGLRSADGEGGTVVLSATVNNGVRSAFERLGSVVHDVNV
jgi:hypothetical protein